MSLMRFTALVALALWIGGLAALGAVAAPTLFETLQAHDPATGRELSGLAFGAVFTRFQFAAWGLGAAVVASLGIRAALGPRPRRLAIRLWVAALMISASVAVVIVIAPRIDRIRTSVTGPVANLPDTDARRVEFGRLHGLSNALMVLTLAGGLGLLWAEMKDPH
jgi:hypothetical protein